LRPKLGLKQLTPSISWGCITVWSRPSPGRVPKTGSSLWAGSRSHPVPGRLVNLSLSTVYCGRKGGSSSSRR
jgi:hypothetical protein